MGSTEEKLRRILQTKEEQKNFLRNVSEINDDTPFKDYLPVIKRLVSSIFNISIPLTASKLNYSGLTAKPKNTAVLYSTGFQATNMLGVQNVVTTIEKRADSAYFYALPSSSNGFNQYPWTGEHKYLQFKEGHYYGFRIEFEKDFELKTTENIAFGLLDGSSYNNVLNRTTYSEENIHYQVIHHEREDLEATIQWKLVPINELQTEYLEMIIKNMYVIDLGTEEITASEMAKQYPNYFENTAHSNFKVLNKSHNILKNVYEGQNATSTFISPFFAFKVGQPLSIQAKINVAGSTTNSRSNIRFQIVNKDGEYSTIKIGNIIYNGEEKISKAENYIPTADVARIRFLITAFDGAVINFSNVQLEVSEKCNEYAPYFEEDLGTYELTGNEDIKDIKRYCWFEPEKGGYLQLEPIENYLLPQLNASSLEYYVEMSNTEIAETINALTTKEVD